MDSKKAKAYILDTTVIQDGRTLEKQLLYLRNGGFICGLSFLFLLGFGAFHANNASIGWIIIFLMTLLGTAITVMIAFKRNKHLVQTKEVSNSTKNTHRGSTYSSVFGAVGAAIGIILVRSLNISQDVMLIGGVIVVIPAIFICTNVACTAQYKLYLLRKYCPEIKDFKPDRTS